MRHLMICALYNVPEPFVSLKVQPICSDGDGGLIVTDENHAEFFSLYAVSPEGLSNCIGDFQTEREANHVKKWIEKLVSEAKPEFLQAPTNDSLFQFFKLK